MNLHISKSKNAESFYICKSYVKANGSTSSMIVRKLGTLEQLLIEHGPTRDDVLAWAKNEVKIETEKYKKENEEKTVLIPKEEKEWTLNLQGFKRVSDDLPVDITKLPEDDKGLYYKDEPYTTKKLHQRLIITYSPKYALYQKAIRDKQVERAQKMLESGSTKKNRKNPNDPARFIGKKAVTKDGEAADIEQYLDEDKIKAHFLICFLSLTIYRYLEKKLNLQYTCEELLDSLKAMNFAEIQEQGFIPLYKREKITDALHESCGFRTDYQFITKSKMKTIQKKSKGKE